MRDHLYILAYDITDDRVRTRLGETLLDAGGRRINKSVFELILTDSERETLLDYIAARFDPSTDQIALYPVCRACYSRTQYLPEPEGPGPKVVIV